MHKTDSPLLPTDAPVPPAQAADEQQKPLIEQERVGISEAPEEPTMSGAPILGQQILSREEKVEYRDQHGNLLDPQQVKELEGKVSFKTRYETRTRLVDAAGNEIPQPEDAAAVAPPHPDVDGSDPSTAGTPEQMVQQKPIAQKEVEADEKKEEKIAKLDPGAAKPASEGNEATA